MSASPDNKKESAGSVFEWFAQRFNLTEMFSLLTSFGLFYTEVDTRKPLREALAEALDRPVPSYAVGLRALGPVVVLLLAIEAVTGVLLTFYYLPTPESAHASTGVILRDVHFGGLIHQVHFWAAQLLIVVLIVRLVRFFVLRIFDPPREMFWMLAALLLLVTFHLDMSGRLLPWTADAYWGSIRALEIVQAVPIYGDAVTFLLGAEKSFISALTLIRAYVFHVGILPAVALCLIYLHFSTVRRVGLAASAASAGETLLSGRQLLRQHAVSLAILLVVLLGIVVSLAILTPTTYEPAADPYSTVPGVGPAWYLLAPFAFLELTSSFLPQWLAGFLLFLSFTTFLVLPLILRRGHSPERAAGGRRGVLIILAGVVVALWLALTFYGMRVA